MDGGLLYGRELKIVNGVERWIMAAHRVCIFNLVRVELAGLILRYNSKELC